MANTTGPRQDTMSESVPKHPSTCWCAPRDDVGHENSATRSWRMSVNETSLTTTVRLGFTLTPKKCSDIPRSTLQTKKWQKTHQPPSSLHFVHNKKKDCAPSASPSKTPGLGVLLVGGRPMKQRKTIQGADVQQKYETITLERGRLTLWSDALLSAQHLRVELRTLRRACCWACRQWAANFRSTKCIDEADKWNMQVTTNVR